MKEATELEFLQWFYCNCDFGSAHEEVVDFMQQEFEKKTGKSVPEGY